MMMRDRSPLLLFSLLLACNASEAQPDLLGAWPACAEIDASFVHDVKRTLTDSTDLFQGAYPVPSGLTCELLEGLQERLKDDSARYHFAHFSRRYWSEDGRNTNGFRFIKRHMDFDLSVAATAHWNADIRIMALDELMNYRRMRPMVCTTKEGYAHLLVQDERTIRYLIHVLENTPWFIGGSENSTIHEVYIGRILSALDLFTGTQLFPLKEGQLHVPFSDQRIRDALTQWKKRTP